MAAVKTVDAATLRAACEAGMRCFGENRVQERAAHQAELSDLPVEWRLIGALQSNKAARALELFDAIDSVDGLDLARRLNRLAGEKARRLPVLIEINIGEEPQKAGLAPAAALAAASELAALEHLDWRGVMALPPLSNDAEATRPFFAAVAALAAQLRPAAAPPGEWHISMGMSHDYAVAIEEGATMVRIGTALFGPRS